MLYLCATVELVTVHSGLLNHGFVVVGLRETFEVLQRDDVLILDPVVDLVWTFAGPPVPGVVARLKEDAQGALLARPLVPLNRDFFFKALQIVPKNIKWNV